jgi:fused signal recognition particle receptor
MKDGPHEILLIMDATTGQNGLSQAKMFHEALHLTGIVLTKLDGTSKGGIVVQIIDELKIPVKYIGIGEGLEDLKVFNPEEFANALF